MRELDLSHNALTHDLCDALQAALAGNSRLTHLDLSDTGIQAGLDKVLAGLQHNHVLLSFRMTPAALQPGFAKTYEKVQQSLLRNRLLGEKYKPAALALFLCSRRRARAQQLAELPRNLWSMIFQDYVLPLAATHNTESIPAIPDSQSPGVPS